MLVFIIDNKYLCDRLRNYKWKEFRYIYEKMNRIDFSLSEILI